MDAYSLGGLPQHLVECLRSALDLVSEIVNLLSSQHLKQITFLIVGGHVPRTKPCSEGMF